MPFQEIAIKDSLESLYRTLPSRLPPPRDLQRPGRPDATTPSWMCAGPHRHSFLKPPSLRGCQGDGGVPGPGPKADLQGGHGPALRAGSPPAEDNGAGRPGVLHLQRAGCGKRPGQGRGEGAGGAEDAGGIFMRWPCRQQAKPVEPRRAVSIRALELQTAKEILGEFSLVVTTNFRIRAKSELLACRFQAHHYGYLELPVVTSPCLCHVNHSFRRYPLTHCLLG